jgi:tetratricopeptide (TPR) repeat protein
MHITRRNGKKIALNWKSVIIVFVIIILYNPILFAQGNGGEMFYIADDYIDNENFTGAINLYKRMLDEDPNNAELNFKLGFCYLNTAHEKDKAIEYIEKSVKQLSKRKRRRSTEYLEASFYLAKAYQANYKFDKALTQYTELKEKTQKQTANFRNRCRNSKMR